MASTYTSPKTGQDVTLSGKVEATASSGQGATSWVDMRHPGRSAWLKAEARARATYIGTRDALVPYLVPHRFEGETEPRKLPRARFGYGLQLNSAYLDEILGHIRSAPARYEWGPMSTDAGPVTDEPKDGVASKLWTNATRDGVTWRNFFEGKVLEWLISAPGGLVIVDAPTVPEGEELRSQRDEERLGIRPFVSFVRMSDVEDAGRGAHGYRWVQIAETRDERGAKGEERQRGADRLHVLYELKDGGGEVGRYNDDGEPVGAPFAIDFTDLDGRQILPLVEVRYGELSPELPWVGSGLLQGLDDIVIDLFNTLSEAREGYRDAAFGFISYLGADPEAVRDYLANGSRFVPVGADPNAKLERISADPSEVDAGLRFMELGIQAWTLSARRNASKAQASAQAQSGVSVVAEFQLDLKPLLVDVAETLDALESRAMYLAGLQAGHSPEELVGVGVKRDTEFRLEDEDSRIARKVGEFLDSLSLPPSAKARITVGWLEASGLVDLDEVIETETSEIDPETGEIVASSEKKTLRDVIMSEAEESALGAMAALQAAQAFAPVSAPGSADEL